MKEGFLAGGHATGGAELCDGLGGNESMLVARVACVGHVMPSPASSSISCIGTGRCLLASSPPCRECPPTQSMSAPPRQGGPGGEGLIVVLFLKAVGGDLAPELRCETSQGWGQAAGAMCTGRSVGVCGGVSQS